MEKFTKNLYFNNITNKIFVKIKHGSENRFYYSFIASDNAFIKTFLQHF